MRTRRLRLAVLLIATLVGACSLPTFNPPKLKTTVEPAGPAAASWHSQRTARS